jgi:hypothetical protein
MTNTQKARMHEREIDIMINGRPMPGVSTRARKLRAVKAQAKANAAWLQVVIGLVSK